MQPHCVSAHLLKCGMDAPSQPKLLLKDSSLNYYLLHCYLPALQPWYGFILWLTDDLMFCQVWGVRFNPESNRLVSVSEDRNINIYDCPVWLSLGDQIVLRICVSKACTITLYQIKFLTLLNILVFLPLFLITTLLLYLISIKWSEGRILQYPLQGDFYYRTQFQDLLLLPPSLITNKKHHYLPWILKIVR